MGSKSLVFTIDGKEYEIPLNDMAKADIVFSTKKKEFFLESMDHEEEEEPQIKKEIPPSSQSKSKKSKERSGSIISTDSEASVSSKAAGKRHIGL